MLYLNHFEPQYLRRVSEELKDATKLVNRLNDVGYFVPPLLPDTRLCHFGIDEFPLAEADAKLVRIKRAGAALVVEGYARLPEARRRADGVLLTVRDEAGRLVVAEHVELRGVPYAAIPESDYRFSGVHIPGVETFAGFRGKLPFARLPDRDSLRIQAWAVDSQRMVVRPFAQHVVLSAGPGGRRTELRNGPGPRRRRRRSGLRQRVALISAAISGARLLDLGVLEAPVAPQLRDQPRLVDRVREDAVHVHLHAVRAPGQASGSARVSNQSNSLRRVQPGCLGAGLHALEHLVGELPVLGHGAEDGAGVAVVEEVALPAPLEVARIAEPGAAGPAIS